MILSAIALVLAVVSLTLTLLVIGGVISISGANGMGNTPSMSGNATSNMGSPPSSNNTNTNNAS